MGTMIFVWLVMLFPMFFWADCPCCSGGGCGVCSGGGSLSDCIEVTVAGISDNDCTNCDNYNGTFTMQWVYGDPGDFQCLFQSEAMSVEVENSPSTCTGETQYWFLFLSFDGSTSYTAVLYAGDSEGDTVITFERFPDAIACTGSTSISFSAYNDTGACTGIPASLSIEPVTCP